MPELIYIGVLVLALAITLLFIFLRLGKNDGSAELSMRLASIEEQQNRTQQLFFEQLGKQQMQLTEVIDERLERNRKTVSESILENTKSTGKTLGDVKEQLGKIVQAQDNITKLSENVVNLQQVLSNRHARGAFGETQMQDIVQTSLPPNAYDFQVTLDSTSGTRVRVDCLIRVPNPPGPVPVDAKFPLEGYRALRSARDEPSLAIARRAFASSVTTHLKDIASKYIIPGETADLALMFLPSEAVYAEIHAEFPNLIQLSQKLRVYIVSPTTMMATLNTVRAILRDAEVRKQAKEIVRSLSKVSQNVVRLETRVGDLSQHFRSAQKDVDQIQISTGKIVNTISGIEQASLSELPELEAAPKEIPVQESEAKPD